MRAAAALALVLMTGCTPTPDSFPVPPQMEPIRVAVPHRCAVTDYFIASDPGSTHHIVKDVRGIESNFRWTHAEPEFRFHLQSQTARRFRMDFGVIDVVLRASGPVQLVFLVNGHELGRETYATAGRKVFEKPVPPEWLRVGEENRVVVRVLNPWRAPDGEILGVTLHEAGFLC